MSRPIGAHFHVPHGLSNAVLLPTITRWSIDGAKERYATIAREMGLADASASDDAATGALVDELDALNADLEVPRLGELQGVEREHFDRVKGDMAEAALASGSPGFNPRVPTAEEIVALYDEAW
jgi:alcohol dehydrogenase class IV